MEKLTEEEIDRIDRLTEIRSSMPRFEKSSGWFMAVFYIVGVLAASQFTLGFVEGICGVH